MKMLLYISKDGSLLQNETDLFLRVGVKTVVHLATHSDMPTLGQCICNCASPPRCQCLLASFYVHSFPWISSLCFINRWSI